MAPADAQAVYRAIDDLGKEMRARLEGMHDQLQSIATLDRDVEGLKIDMTAAHGIMSHHEHRITEMEGHERQAVDERRTARRHRWMLGVMMLVAVVGPILTWLLSH